MVPVGVPDGVGRTALGMALVRAMESRRPDRLFDDPHAEAFLAAAPGALPDGWTTDGAPGANGLVHGAVVRTRFFDDVLLDACAEGRRQVVLVAAGLDTRAYRLAWPDGVRLFELDLPDVLAFKERVLGGGTAPRCGRTVVPVDLRHGWSDALVSAGFEVGVPAVWLVEGLLVYLSAGEADDLIATIGRLSAPGSRLSCEHRAAVPSGRPDGPPSGPPATPTMAAFAAMWKGGLGGATADRLTAHGWLVRTHDRATLAAGYGRPDGDASGAGFIVADRPAP